jgi:hypothetical protein
MLPRWREISNHAPKVSGQDQTIVPRGTQAAPAPEKQKRESTFASRTTREKPPFKIGWMSCRVTTTSYLANPRLVGQTNFPQSASRGEKFRR